MQYDFAIPRGLLYATAAGMAGFAYIMSGLSGHGGREFEDQVVEAGLWAFYFAHMGFIVGYVPFRKLPPECRDEPVRWYFRVAIGVLLGAYAGGLTAFFGDSSIITNDRP